ncbi:hypothetical protein SS50377_28423 [Spironucleus salmonicida]|uniref:Uncharacterized protein n=1 Tax=Spironucleus salmonicida TaxID=348837 RepID=A0A9P8LJC6_9EUKA|nr:hypothetical protein SS50377_28423 [Spironucleus salmonicida]
MGGICEKKLFLISSFQKPFKHSTSLIKQFQAHCTILATHFSTHLTLNCFPIFKPKLKENRLLSYKTSTPPNRHRIFFVFSTKYRLSTQFLSHEKNCILLILTYNNQILRKYLQT